MINAAPARCRPRSVTTRTLSHIVARCTAHAMYGGDRSRAFVGVVV
jgi:hypothetical protein